MADKIAKTALRNQVGESEFKVVSSVDAYCGEFDTEIWHASSGSKK